MPSPLASAIWPIVINRSSIRLAPYNPPLQEGQGIAFRIGFGIGSSGGSAPTVLGCVFSSGSKGPTGRTVRLFGRNPDCYDRRHRVKVPGRRPGARRAEFGRERPVSGAGGPALVHIPLS